MATQIHGAGPAGQRSPGLDLAIAGYLAENPPAGGGASALNDLTDVDTTGQTTGDVLKYDGTSWIADAASAGTVTSTDISDSTATGRAVLTAADAATARSAIGAAPAAAGVPSGGTTGQVLAKASAADGDTTWVDQSGGGGGGGPSILDLHQTRATLGQGAWVPTATIGGHATFTMTAGRLLPCPLILNRSLTVDQVGVRVEPGVPDATIELALYTWDEAAGTSDRLAVLGTVDASTAGFKTASFTPIPLTRGVYVVVARPIGGNVTVWGRTNGLLMMAMAGPSGGTNTYLFPHAAAGSMPAVITWDWAAGITSGNGAFPALQIGASA